MTPRATRRRIDRTLPAAVILAATSIMMAGPDDSAVHAVSALASQDRPAGAHTHPPSFRTGDGEPIPIQREWAEQKDPALFDHLPRAEQPFRFDRRTPELVHRERRAGHEPVHYFRNVRRGPPTGTGSR